ncbi:MAG: flippase, partial [Candidatus Micrarchaeota archaeon]|nr:flippase [Candidatus Micrarchaeota archaeon]
MPQKISVQRSGIEILAFGSVYALIGAVLSKVFTYAYRLLVAGAGPEAYGLISLGISVVVLTVTVSLLGLGEGLTRFIPEYRQKNQVAGIKGAMSFSFKIGLFVGALCTVVLFFGAEFFANNIFHEPSLAIILRILSISIIPYIFLTLIAYVFNAFENVKLVVYSRHFAENILRLVATFILLYLGYGIVGAAIAYTLGTIVATFFAFYWLETSVFPFIRTKIVSKINKRELLNFSLPLLMSGMMWTILVWADTIILGAVRNAYEVGIYNAAAPTAMILVAVPQIALSIFTPLVTRLHAEGKSLELHEIYRRSTKWVLVLALPIAFLFAFFSRSVIHQLFGADYAAAAPSLAILAFGYLIYDLLNGSESMIRISKRTDIIFGIALLTTILNLILNVFLSQQYGAVGSSIATAIGLSLYALLNTIFAFKL